jgi:hypothetical protein
MEYDRARRLVAALLRAETEETVVYFRQPGLSVAQQAAVGHRGFASPSSANATVVNLDGPAATVLAGQFATLVAADGRVRLVSAVQTNAVPGPVIIRPPLRIPTSEAVALDFISVRLQGFGPKGVEWDVDEAHHYGLSFSIKERK